MDLLLDVQLQLSRVVASVTKPPRSFVTSCPTSTVLMTPVLIHIEQLLDEIRATTRAIVSKHSVLAIPSPITAKNTTEFADFRVKLESEDVVDYASETETEDDEKDGREEEQRDGGEIRDGIGGKRPRDAEDDEGEAQCKRQNTQLESEKDIQLRRSIEKVVQSATECSSLRKDAPTQIVWKAVTGLIQSSTHAIKQMLKMTQDGRIPDLKLADDFSEAMVQLPVIITHHHAKKKMSPNWIKTTSANLKHLYSYAKKNPTWPTCLSDSSIESTPEAIRGLWEVAAPDLLHKMEGFIEHVTKGGPLHADQMEKPVGKLASFFRKDFKSPKSREMAKRTEEEWGRFAVIGKVLAEWIYESQKAKKPPKMRKHLLRFDLQLKGFAKKNPNRVPPILLEASTILVEWLSQKNASKPATDLASS
ncbi:hypothetical protein V7S43_014310 [Phytophthora oleae]|uniref:Uncharacterized protein n=1 Tax=Phytophthora oleae TaxID=2107226 RepID=A0ABD3F171_9STRA